MSDTLAWVKNASGIEVVRVLPNGEVHINPNATVVEVADALRITAKLAAHKVPFTRWDVMLLRNTERGAPYLAEGGFASIADRIERLLPPVEAGVGFLVPAPRLSWWQRVRRWWA